MKQIFILALCFVCVVCKAQLLGRDCGTWEPKKIEYTQWENIDTLRKGTIKDTVRDWVYGEKEFLQRNTTTAEYRPCGGYGYPLIWEQFRVCRITGIRQSRREIQEYAYIPKPKTPYQQIIDSIKNQH